MEAIEVEPIENALSPLNERQTAFVIAYLKTGNGTKSAIAAGYSEASAASQASGLLQNPKIKQAITEARRPALERLGASQELVIEHLLWEMAQARKEPSYAGVGHAAAVELGRANGLLKAKYDGTEGEPQGSGSSHLLSLVGQPIHVILAAINARAMAK